jgi:ABC-type dipeptide/oligopeptide/nickel transport system permease component
VATVARSVLRRASRSLTLVFSALIWSNIVGVVVGMVAFSGVRSIGMINLAGV